MASKAVRALLVAFAALVLTAGAVMPAMAQESPGVFINDTNEVSAQAVDWKNGVATTQTLYQCPGTHCNRGEARPGHVLREPCVLHLGSIKWALVYNEANGHTGFLDALRLIHEDPTTSCNDVGRPGGVTGSWTLFQCPAEFCNRGSASTNDELRYICYIPGHDGSSWLWVFNKTNLHEGFLHTAGNLGLQRCT